MATQTRKYLAVADWEKLQYHKKLENPPWTRLHQSWLNDYEFSQLSLQQWGVLFGLHMLAARTGNRIPYDPAWISKQFGKKSSPVSKVILNLISAGFLLEFEDVLDLKENRRLPTVRSVETTSPEGEGRGRTEIDTDSSLQHRASTTRERADKAAPHLREKESENSIPPAPPRTRRNGRMHSLADVTRSSGTRGHDRRSFDELKQAVLPVALQLNCRDPEELHRLAGQSLRISPKQCTAALRQLIEDGQL